MTDPIRAAMERLLARLHETTDPNGPVPAWSDSFFAACAALSADGPAVPEGREPAAVVGEPSDEELLDAFDDEFAEFFDSSKCIKVARAVLARWGRHPTPPAEGEAKDEPPVPISAHDLATQWNQQADGFNQWNSLDLGEQLAWAQARATALDRSRRAPVEPAEHEKGLHGKYIIHRSRDGSPVDYPCFVLRLDGSDPAAMAAMRAYAEDPACPPELAGDLAVYCSIPAQVQPAEREVGELVDKCIVTYAEDPAIISSGSYMLIDDGKTRGPLLTRIADLLALRHPAPVPVSERPWERDGWCDEQGCCWWGRSADEFCNPDWHYATYADVKEFCSDAMPQVTLPFHTLPLASPATAATSADGSGAIPVL